MSGLIGGAPKAPSIDYAAQAAAQQVSREAEESAQLAKDRAEALAKADEARETEAARIKRLKGAGGSATGLLNETANVDVSGLKAKLG